MVKKIKIICRGLDKFWIIKELDGYFTFEVDLFRGVFLGDLLNYLYKKFPGVTIKLEV